VRRRPEIPGFSQLVEIGEGASATVYRADQPAHGRQVAIKVLNTTMVAEAERLAFERELTAMGRLADHPHIVDLLQSGFSDDGRPYIVMPWYRRGNYAARVDRDGPLGWVEVLDFGVKVASALHTAHSRQIVHRDVKPANVYMGAFASHPILADFGISSFVRPSLDGQPTVTISTTPLFAAPEVLNGERPTVASDLYSFGATLFSLLTGRAAYGGASVEVLVAAVTSDRPPPRPDSGGPPALDDLVTTMLAKDPDDRPPSLLDTAHRLAALQRAQGLDPTPVVVDEDPGPAPPARPNLATPPVGIDTVDTTAPPGPSSPPPRQETERSGPAAGHGQVAEAPGAAAPPDRLVGLATVEVRPEHRVPDPRREKPPETEPPSPPTRRRRWPTVAAVLVAAIMIVLAVGYASSRRGGDPPPPASSGAWTAAPQLVESVAAHQGPARAVAFSPDATRLATGGQDEVLRLAPADEPGTVAAVAEEDGWVLGLAWSPDGTALATATGEGTVAVHTVDAPAGGGAGLDRAGPQVTITAHPGTTAEAVAWSPTGDTLASAGGDGQVRLWRPDGTPIRNLAGDSPGGEQGAGQAQLAVAWSPDGANVAAGGKDGVLRVWDAGSGRLLASLGHPDWVRSVEWSPDGRHLATSSPDGVSRVWSLDGAGRVTAQIDAGADLTGPTRWSPDGLHLAAGLVDGPVVVWDPASGRELARSPVPDGDGDGGAAAVVALAWLGPGGDRLAVGRQGGTVEIWAGESA